MFKRTLHLIRKSPIIIVPYVIFNGVNLILSRFIVRLESMALNPEKVAAAANKIMGFWILIMVITVLFASGYGSMLGTAVKGEKCRFKDFFTGIDYFLGRMMIYSVLLFFMAVSFFIVITIAASPIIMAASIGGIKNTSVMAALLITGAAVLMIFITPSVMLWYPAIFIEDAGVIDGLKRGLIVSRKCYWKLVLATLMSILPFIAYTIAATVINANFSAGLTKYYILYTAVNIILSFLIFIYIFVAYYTIKDEIDT